MSETPVKYRRLPGRGRRFEGLIPFAAPRNSVWLGPDHLLSVDRVWMNEEYKRFYFRDIQAITVQKTNSASMWSWIHGTLTVCSALLFGFLALDAATRSEGRTGYFIAGGIIAGFWFVLFLINLLRGASCICRLRTAVQTEELPCLGRVGSASRAIAVMKPLIEQAQGTLAAGEIARRAAGPAPAAQAPNVNPLPPSAAPVAPPPSRPPANGRVHAALFGVLILDALCGVFKHVHMVWHLYLLVSTLLLLAVTTLSILAVVRQRDTAVPPALRSLTAFTFAWVLTVLFVVFIYGTSARMVYSMQYRGNLPTSVNFYSLWGFWQLSLFADIAQIGLGGTGLVMIMIHLYGKKKTPGAGAEHPTR